MSERRSVVVVAVSEAEGETPGAVVRISGAEGAVPLSAESCHLARESSSMRCRSAVLSVGWPMFASAGGETASVMRSAKRDEASNLTSGSPARVVCTLRGSRLVQILRRK